MIQKDRVIKMKGGNLHTFTHAVRMRPVNFYLFVVLQTWPSMASCLSQIVCLWWSAESVTGSSSQRLWSSTKVCDFHHCSACTKIQWNPQMSTLMGPRKSILVREVSRFRGCKIRVSIALVQRCPDFRVSTF